MTGRHRLTDVDTVVEEGSWLFTVRDGNGAEAEVVLVPCEPESGADESEGAVTVEAWINRCTHAAQRLHREGVGVVTRGGEIVCPRHGSMFDACSGECDNGPAADTTLPSVEVTVEDGQVYLTDDADYLHAGGTDGGDADDDGPSSTSHLGL